MTYLGMYSVLAHFGFRLWLVSISGEGSLPEITLSCAFKLASTYFSFYRSVQVLYTEICILSGCLCSVDSVSQRVATPQLSVFNCRLESDIFIENG